MHDIEGIFKAFLPDAALLGYERYGQGHINDTFRLDCLLADGRHARFILQRINHAVFKDVDALMENIRGVTEYIRSQVIKSGGDLNNVIEIILTADGGHYHTDKDGNRFRMMNFISRGVSIEGVPDKRALYLSGQGFGRFQRFLDGYPATRLNESIPDFHNTRVRFKNFLRAVSEDKAGRVRGVADEIAFFTQRESYTGVIVDLLASGRMPTRVTHNDTKINNILVDLENNTAVTAIDLDTVMCGSVCYDFGDSIRSGANTGEEDQTDLAKVGFSMENYEAFAKGFLEEVGQRLTPIELEHLAFGAVLMTYECGMRFLTDYLDGDVYFKIHRPFHNLDRARTQIKLVTEMEERLPQMQEIIFKYVK